MIPENAVAIRVIQTPDGDAPAEYRRQWIGLILFPAIPYDGRGAVDIVSKSPMEERPSYLVPSAIAIAVLACKSPEAAKFFLFYASPGLDFTYGADEVEVIG